MSPAKPLGFAALLLCLSLSATGLQAAPTIIPTAARTPAVSASAAVAIGKFVVR